ncbi:FAD-binding oxidoreductase [Candidatus Gracilibacteria bacterium]|nr:FAD-binding oxidoreductase [Candidatus Gracilibacteria bacterium]
MGSTTIHKAQYIVVGGGIFGVSAAYHLQKAGVGRVILLEREPELATQTSRGGGRLYCALVGRC